MGRVDRFTPTHVGTTPTPQKLQDELPQPKPPLPLSTEGYYIANGGGRGRRDAGATNVIGYLVILVRMNDTWNPNTTARASTLFPIMNSVPPLVLPHPLERLRDHQYRVSEPELSKNELD